MMPRNASLVRSRGRAGSSSSAVFGLATWRGVHLGLLMFVAACAVGPGLAGMTLREVIGGFPVAILILVAGVTYFFGIAQLNGTLDRVMTTLVARTDGRPTLMPVLFFGLAALMAAMGSPQAGLATGPVGMATARRAGVDAVLMAIAINSGICAGSFAPTSLFGVITYRVAQRGRHRGEPLRPPRGGDRGQRGAADRRPGALRERGTGESK